MLTLPHICCFISIELNQHREMFYRSANDVDIELSLVAFILPFVSVLGRERTLVEAFGRRSVSVQFIIPHNR